jgi:hypothetical protein
MKILCDGPALDGGTDTRAGADIRCIISSSLMWVAPRTRLSRQDQRQRTRGGRLRT